ncbi:MAG: hypothetical protein RIE58_07055 [Vicingaceae bacterium]
MRQLYFKVVDFFSSVGFDVYDKSHPIGAELHSVQILKNEVLFKCYEHFLMLLIIDISKIKKFSYDDYDFYLKQIRVKDTSFWGIRFEIFWYARMIEQVPTLINNLKRGEAGLQPDFVANNMEISFETTSLNYMVVSKKSNPIQKILKKINEKDRKIYSDLNCCLIVDITNLSFYRKLLSNFKQSIDELFNSLQSNFGAVLLLESYHIESDKELHFRSQVYTWMNPNIDEKLSNYLKVKLKEQFDISGNKVYFKNF